MARAAWHSVKNGTSEVIMASTLWSGGSVRQHMQPSANACTRILCRVGVGNRRASHSSSCRSICSASTEMTLVLALEYAWAASRSGAAPTVTRPAADISTGTSGTERAAKSKDMLPHPAPMAATTKGRSRASGIPCARFAVSRVHSTRCRSFYASQARSSTMIGTRGGSPASAHTRSRSPWCRLLTSADRARVDTCWAARVRAHHAHEAVITPTRRQQPTTSRNPPQDH